MVQYLHFYMDHSCLLSVQKIFLSHEAQSDKQKVGNGFYKLILTVIVNVLIDNLPNY